MSWCNVTVERLIASTKQAPDSLILWRTSIIDRATAWMKEAPTSFASWRTMMIARAAAWGKHAASTLVSWHALISRAVRAGSGQATTSLLLWHTGIVDEASRWRRRAAVRFPYWRTAIVDSVAAYRYRAGGSIASWRALISHRAPIWADRAVTDFASWRILIIDRFTGTTHRTANAVTFWLSGIGDRATIWSERAAARFASWRTVLVARSAAWINQAPILLASWRAVIEHRATASAHRAASSFAWWRTVAVERSTAGAHRATATVAAWRSATIARTTTSLHRAGIVLEVWSSILYGVAAGVIRAASSFASYRYLIVGITTLAVLAPVFLLLHESFLAVPLSTSSAQPGINAYHFVFAQKDFGVALATTVMLGIGMTVIAVPFGGALAFLVVRTDVPGRLWLEPFILLVFFMPAVVLAFGYIAALGPAGILTSASQKWIGAAPWNVYSFPFLVVMAGLTHVPHVYFCIAAALRALGSEAEEAAVSAGAKPWRVALGVSLPMAMPAILFAGALVMLLGFELFGLPLVLGDARGVLVLSTYLYKLGSNVAASPNQVMAVIAVVIAAITLPLLFMLRLLLNEMQTRTAGRSKSLRQSHLKLRGWRWLAFAVIVLWLLVTVLLPLAAITLQSFVETGSQGITLPTALTVGHYRALLDRADVTRSIINTLAIGLFGGAAAVAVYAAIALAAHRWRSHWPRALDYLVMVPGAMPGLVAGFALLLLLFLFKPLSPLRETLVPVWMAYTLVWLACGVQFASVIFGRIDPQLEDIARTVGATPARVRVDVTLPLVRNGLLAGWALVFLVFVREYATGIYLVAPGTEVIGALLVSLWGKGAIDLVSALSVVNVGIIGGGLVIARRLGVRLHG
jgi:iron(III) transport system permease protein